MDRRSFVKNGAMAFITLETISSPGYAAATDDNIRAFDVLFEARKIQLFRNTSLPQSNDPAAPQNRYKGCYLNQVGGYLNWYLNNIAINSMINILTQDEIKSYLRSYILNLTIPASQTVEQASIHGYRAIDVVFSNNTTPSNPGYPSYRTYDDQNKKYYSSDSDDSYAATFITLFASYIRRFGDIAFLDQNIGTLINIAIFNITRSYKSTTMLTSAFRTDSNLGPSLRTSIYGSLAFLMDNCEVYKGLKDLIYLMQSSTANYSENINIISSYASNIRAGIYRLYKTDPLDGITKFMPSDDDSNYNKLIVTMDLPDLTKTFDYASVIFYPGRTAQLFPQVFGVPDNSGNSLSNPSYDAAWSFFFKNSNWAYCVETYFPWMIAGYTAALRGKTTPGEYFNAKLQMQSMITIYQGNTARVPISEIGYFQKAKETLMLAGQL